MNDYIVTLALVNLERQQPRLPHSVAAVFDNTATESRVGSIDKLEISGVARSNIAAPLPTGLSDSQLAAEFNSLIATKCHVLFVVNKFTAAMFSASDGIGPWAWCQVGELGDECADAISAKIRTKRIWWASSDLAAPETARTSELPIVQAKAALLKSWMTASDAITGRMGHVSLAIKQEVTYVAANRCQFSGCGKDLGKHAATGQKGVFSYFAHIVAASVDGPRGHATDSIVLADEPSNFLLLCDECHRLIDKVNPAKYSVEVLRAMRDESVREVKRLLANLRYPEVDTVFILGNVSGQMPHINERDAEEALWQSKLRSSSKTPESFFHFGGQHHAPHEASYWSALFQTLKFDLPQIQSKLNGIRTSGTSRPRLAVFPFHGTSLLLLAGRVLGDMPGTYLFQPHRNKVGELTKTRWAWPTDAKPPAADKFKVTILQDRIEGVDEATLIVSLTFGIKTTRLAEPSAADGHLKLPTIEITVGDLGHSTIRHPADLTLFGHAVDCVFKQLQDEWGIKIVHLYVGAPATAVMTLGQKMQARNQATFVCYESLPNGNEAPFSPTIQISSQDVKAICSGQAVPLQT